MLANEAVDAGSLERLENSKLQARAGGTLPRRPLAEHPLRPRQSRPAAVIHPSHDVPQGRDATVLVDHPFGEHLEPLIRQVPGTVEPCSGWVRYADAIVAFRPVLRFEHVGPAEHDTAADR